MNFKKKLFCFLIIISLFSYIRPQKTYSAVFDVPNTVQGTISAVANSGLTIKELALDTAAYFIINKVIKKITAQTVNWINSGFKGNPAYVTNPGQFFLDVGDEQVSKFLSETSLANLCLPFKTSIRVALVKNYLAETDNKVYACTLDKIAGNYEGFMSDFDQGGWDGWFEITQNQQNNPYGAYQDAKNKMSIEIGNKEQKFQKQLDWGKGILSFERCKKENILTQADIDNGYGDEGYVAGDCYDSGNGDNKETVTPGGVIENQLNSVLSSGNNRLEVADEINEMIVGLLDQLTNKIFGGIQTGLRGLTEPGGSGGNSFIDDLSNQEDTKELGGEGFTCETLPSGETSCTPTQPPAQEVKDPTGIMTCDENLQNCVIEVGEPASSEVRSSCYYISQEIVRLQNLERRQADTVARLTAIGCQPRDNDCIEKLNKAKWDLDKTREAIAFQQRRSTSESCPTN